MQVRRMIDFLGLFIHKIFQILLSLLVAFFFVIYILEIYSCIDPTFWCTFKNEAQNCIFNSIYSLIMIFVLGFWEYSLYKSYKNPFTWKLFFIHVAGVLAFIIIVPRVVKIMVSSETYQEGAEYCFEVVSKPADDITHP